MNLPRETAEVILLRGEEMIPFIGNATILKDYPIHPLPPEFTGKRQHPILNHGEFKFEMREGGCELPVICSSTHHQVRKVHNY